MPQSVPTRLDATHRATLRDDTRTGKAFADLAVDVAKRLTRRIGGPSGDSVAPGEVARLAAQLAEAQRQAETAARDRDRAVRLQQFLQAALQQERRRADEAHHHATHDALTGLMNRRGLIAGLEAELGRAARDGGRVGIILIDVDGFKAVNDQRGHAAGDQLLVRLGRALEAATPAPAFAARVGGDEFVIVVPELPGAVTVATLAAKLVPQLAAQGPAEGPSIGISLGTSAYPDDGDTADEVLHAADLRMYQTRAAVRHRGLAASIDSPRARVALLDPLHP